MNSHLVAIEVGVERGTYQRMQLDRLTLYQNGLECLDTQSVQGRGAVQHNRMLLNDIFQHIPYLGVQSLHQLLRVLDVLRNTPRHQLLHHEGLEQLNGHLLGQAALINLQLRPYYDNASSGIVNTLSEQVLTETSGLTLQHVRQGLQSSVSRTCHRTAAASVVNQGVYRFLQHTLLVADDDIRSAQLQQSLQTVVAVDNSSV